MGLAQGERATIAARAAGDMPSLPLFGQIVSIGKGIGPTARQEEVGSARSGEDLSGEDSG